MRSATATHLLCRSQVGHSRFMWILIVSLPGQVLGELAGCGVERVVQDDHFKRDDLVAGLVAVVVQLDPVLGTFLDHLLLPARA